MGYSDEQRFRAIPSTVAVMAIMGAVLLVTAARPALAVLYVVGMTGLFLVIAVRPWLRRKVPARVTLVIDPDELRLTTSSANGTKEVTFQRADADTLARVTTDDRRDYAEKLQLCDQSGRVRLELPDRPVSIQIAPFGVDLRAFGIDPKRAPLGIIVGTWWPNPEHRFTTRNLNSLAPMEEPTRPWGQPDLTDYGLWKGRQKLIEGISIAVVGFALASVVTFALLSGVRMEPVGTGTLIAEVMDLVGLTMLTAGIGRALFAVRRAGHKRNLTAVATIKAMLAGW